MLANTDSSSQEKLTPSWIPYSDIFLSSASINSLKCRLQLPLLPTWKFSWLFVNPCCAFNPYFPCGLQAQTGLSRSRLVPSFQYNQVLSLCCLKNIVLLGLYLKKHSMSLASSHSSPSSHHASPFRMSIQNWAHAGQSAVWRESQPLLSWKARDTNKRCDNAQGMSLLCRVQQGFVNTPQPQSTSISPLTFFTKGKNFLLPYHFTQRKLSLRISCPVLLWSMAIIQAPR